MLEEHQAPWRRDAPFRQRAWSDLRDMAGEGRSGWRRIVLLFLLPPVLPFMVYGVLREDAAPGDRIFTACLALCLTAWWCTIFVPMLRPSPRIRRVLGICLVVETLTFCLLGLGALVLGLLAVAVGSLTGGEAAQLAASGGLFLFAAVVVAVQARSVLRAGDDPVPPAPGYAPPHPQHGPPPSLVWLRDPMGHVRSTQIGPVQPWLSVECPGGPRVLSRVAALLGDPTGRWVVPPTAPVAPGQLLVTEVLPSGQVSFLVSMGAAPVARMWAHARPVRHPQERR